MEHSTSWGADSRLATQQIPRVLWNPKVRYCGHKNLPPVSILN
jgi:hypothetical protein